MVPVSNSDSASTPQIQGAGRVLLGEPDERTADLIRHRLGRLGCQVHYVQEGAEVLAHLGNEPFEAIVINLRMPGVHGLEILKRIRRHHRHARTPVIVLSSTSNEQDLVRAFALGASDYILKPFSPKEFIARVGRFLPEEKVGYYLRRVG